MNTITTILIMDETAKTLEGKDPYFVIDNLSKFDCIQAGTFINQQQIFSSTHHEESEILNVIDVGGGNASALNTNHNIKLIPLESLESGDCQWNVLAKSLPMPKPPQYAVHMEGGVIQNFFSEDQSPCVLKIFEYDTNGAAEEDIISIDGEKAYLGSMNCHIEPDADLSEVFA